MDPRHAAYSVVAQIGHDSLASGAPLPPSPLLLLLNSPIFEKSDGKLFDQSEPLRAADSLSQPGTRHGEFSIFSTQIFGLNIFELEGFLQRNYLQDFSVQQQQCTWNVFGMEAKIWAAIFPSSKGCCWFKCLLSKPWFPLFPPSSFLNFWHGRPLKYVTAPDFNQNFEQNFLRDRKQDLGTEEMHLFQTTFWFTRI